MPIPCHESVLYRRAVALDDSRISIVEEENEMNPLVEKALEIARTRLGVREIGNSNTGVEVNGYLARVGDAPGNPWCAAFAYTNIDDAAHALGVRNPYLRSGYCPDIGHWARSRNILFSNPAPGDSFLQIHGDDFHHTGHVEDVNGDQFDTIEGNTNSNGSREGFEVEAKTRTVSAAFAYVRWALLCDPAPGAAQTRALLLSGKKVCDMPVLSNVSLCPVRRWCAWMGESLVWDNSEEPPVVINGVRLAAEISLINGAAYAPLRALAETIKKPDGSPGLVLSFDALGNTVFVTRA